MKESNDPFNVKSSKSSELHLLKLAVIALFAVACAASFFTGIQAKAAQQKTEKRFDYLVRADFFAGFAGDQTALDRAMKLCEETLAKNPRHAEAMVWHGGGLLFISGRHFQKGDVQKGMELWNRGLKEMDEAVALAPDSVSVLIPRGATLIPASRFVRSADESKALLQKGVNDYEKVLGIQKTYFAGISGHARGELLFGLAEGWQRLGNAEKSRGYFQRIVTEAQGSERQQQAKDFLATGTLPASTQSCTGCHN
jgi:tetratricopeptide (TPR) repeat protein